MIVHIKHEARLARIREALKYKKIDCLVGTRLKTITHTSGAFVPWRSVVVIPAESEPRLITLMLDAERVKDDSWLSNVLPYDTKAGQASRLRFEVERGPDGKIISKRRVTVRSGTTLNVVSRSEKSG